MDEMKNGRRMLDMEELDKVVGGEDRRPERDPSRQRFITGDGASHNPDGAPPGPLTPEQIQALLDAANENLLNIGPVKK